MIALTCYATEEFEDTQRDLGQAALEHGARRVSLWRPGDLKRDGFYDRHRDILVRPRGAGYWLWKPYIILAELERLDDGDMLIYSDSGKAKAPQLITRPLNILTEWVRENLGGMLPGFYCPQFGRNARWTKGECFAVMNCRSSFFQDHPQIGATYSVWEKHDRSIAFVREWLHWCTNPAALLDDQVDPSIPNSQDFKDHRHDQSVLTLLALKQGLRCFGSPLEVRNPCKRIDTLIDRIADGAPAESFADRFPSLSAV